MKKVLIIGAGAMGAAFSFPLLDNNNKVTLTEPYNTKLTNQLLKKRKFHPSLKIILPKKLLIKKFSSQLLLEKWDLIVVAVSSIGIELVKKYLKNLNKKTYLLVLTKGLKFDRKKNKIITKVTTEEYKYGFVSNFESDTIECGLNEDIITLISRKKNEPKWMLEKRLHAFEILKKMPQQEPNNKPDVPKDKIITRIRSTQGRLTAPHTAHRRRATRS